MINELAKVEKITALEVFNTGYAETLVGAIEAEVRSFIPDLKTDKSRKEIASLSAKVSKSKVLLDGLGKNLVAAEKEKLKLVDSERKMIRDRLDALRDEARKPLTEWENAEKAKIESERVAKEMLEAYEQALVEDDLINRQKEIERKEEEYRQHEADKLAKEEAERVKAERIELDKEIAAKAVEDEKKKADELWAKEKAEAEQKIIDAKAAVELERLKAKEAAEKAETDKLEAIKAAEQKAADNAKAVERERQAAADKEKAEVAAVAAAASKKAANKKHQATINNGILSKLEAIGVDNETAKKLITAIVKKEIANLSINY